MDKAKQVIEAFNQNYISFRPEERRRLASEMVEAGIEPQGVMAKYASSELSRHFKSNLMTRRAHVDKEELDKILEKSASMDLNKLAKLIETVDQMLGLDEYYDGQIPDAFETVFEFSKQAEPEIAPEKLKEIAEKKEIITGYFTEKLASAFITDPVNTYERMSRPQQAVIISLAGK